MDYNQFADEKQRDESICFSIYGLYGAGRPHIQEAAMPLLELVTSDAFSHSPEWKD